MVCDSWLVDFVPFCLFHVEGSLLCDRPVLGNYGLVKFALQIFMIFLILVTCKNKATSASFRRQKIHSPSWFPLLLLSSLESLSAKRNVHVTLWFALTPPSLKWLMEQKNPKSLWSLQNTRRNTMNFAVKHQEKKNLFQYKLEGGLFNPEGLITRCIFLFVCFQMEAQFSLLLHVSHMCLHY